MIDPDKMVRLRGREFSSRFYEERYAHGYMEDWPPAKKRRIFEIIRGLDLPARGQALDFGCGNGVFTEVMRQALPTGWSVAGLDVSTIAIANAGKRYPRCRFILAGSRAAAEEKFDLIFTHHVLEHVYDLEALLSEICSLAKEKAAILHVLPCGNPGSFEYKLCSLRMNGIDAETENRFFFEDEGHIRRLSSEELARRMAERRFSLKKEFFSGQFFGAINWITGSSWAFVRQISDASAAISLQARRKLKRIRRWLIFLAALRFPSQSLERKLRKRPKDARDFLVLTAELPFYLPSRLADAVLRSLARMEWHRRKGDRKGSEMYLLFSRLDPD